MKTMFKIIGIIVLLLMVQNLSAQDELNQYLAVAAENNPGVKAKFNEYLAALEKVPRVGTLPDPQVSFGYFIQPVETRVGPQRAKISASQMFPWFGTLGAKRDIATEMAKSKYETFEAAKSELFYKVKANWYNLYFTQKAIGITRENINILQIFRKISLSKVESGQASTVDVLRVEIEISDLENQLALLNDKYTAQQAGFNNLLNVEENRTVLIPDSLKNETLAYSREAILDSIRQVNPALHQLDYMASAYEQQESLARKSGSPNIMVGADYIITGKSNMPEVSGSGKDAIVFPMVGISVPIYQKKYASMEKEAQLMQQSVEAQKADRTNKLESDFETANKDYNDAGRRIPLFKLQSERANKALSILQTEYETDGKNFEEILRMERQLLKYKLELEKARSDKGAAIAYIEYLMGQ